MIFIQYFVFGSVFISVAFLLYKLFHAENFISVLVLCSTISSVITITLGMYSVMVKNTVTLDAICLFYLTSHMVPLIYSIVLLYKNGKVKPF